MTQVLSMEEETFQLGVEQGIEQGLEQGLEQGIEQGAANATQAIAENMLRGGFDVSKIVELTALSADRVSELQHQLHGIQS